MNKKDAEQAANKRIKAEKIIAATAAITITAAVAYNARNAYAREFTDSVLKSGKKLHTVDINPDRKLDSRFYAAYGKRDRIIYKGLYGNQLLQRGNKVVDINSKITKDLKIPSRRKAAEVFVDLYKNDADFRKAFDNNVRLYSGASLNPKQKSVFNKVASNRSDKVLLKEGYNAFNIALANRSSQSSEASQKFYSKLKEMGYGAVRDINDSKYSGFKSKNPLIVFDTDSVIKDKVDHLTEKHLKKNFYKQDLIRNGKTYAAQLGAVGGGLYYTSRQDKKPAVRKKR